MLCNAMYRWTPPHSVIDNISYVGLSFVFMIVCEGAKQKTLIYGLESIDALVNDETV